MPFRNVSGKIESLRHKKIVLFDECHRSQFGETHERITKFFEKSQLIGLQEHLPIYIVYLKCL
jgi:type I site-specific restriction-modification system R (restriction) subunit